MKEKFKKSMVVTLCLCLLVVLCTPNFTYAKTKQTTTTKKATVKAVIKDLPSVVAVEEGKDYTIKGNIVGKIPQKSSVKVSSTNKNLSVISAKQKGKQYLIKVSGKNKGKAKLCLQAYYNKKCTATRYITVTVTSAKNKK